jgi:hypothetical protein
MEITAILTSYEVMVNKIEKYGIECCLNRNKKDEDSDKPPMLRDRKRS